MNALFDNHKDSNTERINLEELYDRKKEVDQMRLQVYKKILYRIHNKIKITSRQRYQEEYIFYVVPEFVIGVPRYDVKHCIIYIMDQLEQNGFIVKYTHPNMIFISWGHYIPKYQRDIIKNKYNISIDSYGNEKKVTNKEITFSSKNHTDSDRNTLLLANTKKVTTSDSSEKTKYKDINSYKPLGVYDKELFHRINQKIDK